MRFGKISDPAPQTHPGILFFTNSKKYENTLGFLKIWGVLKQNGQNHAFLNSGGMSYPFNIPLVHNSNLFSDCQYFRSLKISIEN